jgi:uncharacterized protein (TIGR02611 family)
MAIDLGSPIDWLPWVGAAAAVAVVVGLLFTRDLHSPVDWLRWIGRNTKRIAVLIAGLAVLGAGVTMLVLPGPGIVVIILGFAILATEFAWAERALDRTTGTAAAAASKVSNNRAGRAALLLSGLALVTGGGFVATFVEEYRVIGISLTIAGLIGLLTLLPRVQGWIDVKANSRTNGTSSEQQASAPTSVE